jgi:PleD family two-component response regulator
MDPEATHETTLLPHPPRRRGGGLAAGGEGAASEASVTQRILVVEDQADNMQILRDLLTSAGYEMIEAEDGLEGVKAATAHRPDLILMG